MVPGTKLSPAQRKRISEAMKRSHARRKAQVAEAPVANAAAAVALSLREMVKEEIKAALAEIEFAALIREEFKKAFE